MDDFRNRFVEARKDYVRSQYAKLNNMQQEAVLATEGALLILAGAGSGKTTVLIHRIANLLKYGCASDSDELPEGADEAMLAALKRGGEEADEAAALHPVAPWRVLAITFTNKAAGELKDRLGKMLGEEADDIWSCTFHSACVRMLRRDAEKLGFPGNFTIYDSADSQSLVKNTIVDSSNGIGSTTPNQTLNVVGEAVLKMEHQSTFKVLRFTNLWPLILGSTD